MNLQGKIILQGEKNKIAKKINSQEKKLKLRQKLKLKEKSKNYQTSYKRKNNDKKTRAMRKQLATHWDMAEVIEFSTCENLHEKSQLIYG